jgi:hypothetical protein
VKINDLHLCRISTFDVPFFSTQSTTMPETRIQSLTAEVDRLRNSHHQADNQLHALLLKITEIQLNLATQDRTLNKLDTAIHGNGQPGLATRVDRTERVLGGLVKSVWLITTALTAAVVRFIIDRWK